MSFASIVWMCMAIGASLGYIIPSLWGAGMISMSTVISSSMGGFIGIWAGYKIGRQ